jgi:hypothetical protein
MLPFLSQVYSHYVPLPFSGIGAAFVADFFVEKFVGYGPFGTGGILVVLAMLNVAVSLFLGTFTSLISRHHPTSWLSPTLAFAFCIVLIRLLGPFSIRFAPFMLGTGAVAWLICCWLLRKKGSRESEHVVQA